MKNSFLFILSSIVIFIYTQAHASSPATHRTVQFNNEKIKVWETIIYPNKNQILKMHRHDNDRVLVSFDSGTLKITNDQGKVHYLALKKDKSYYLSKDIPNEMHNDENISNHPIKVLVIELK